MVRSDVLVTSQSAQCISQVWEINEADIQLTDALYPVAQEAMRRRRTPNPCYEAARREPRRPLPEPLAGSSLTARPVAASSASPQYSAERRRVAFIPLSTVCPPPTPSHKHRQSSYSCQKDNTGRFGNFADIGLKPNPIFCAVAPDQSNYHLYSTCLLDSGFNVTIHESSDIRRPVIVTEKINEGGRILGGVYEYRITSATAGKRWSSRLYNWLIE